MTPPPRSGPWNSVAQQLTNQDQPTGNNPHLEYYRAQQQRVVE